MCDAVKCRAADDLVVVAEWHPNFEKARLDLTFKPLPQLIKLAASRASLPERALALWFGTGTNQYNTSRLRERRGDPQTVFDGLCEAGLANDVVEVSREGFRKGAGILALCVALLHHDESRTVGHVEPDDLLPEETIRGVPCWSLDMHTRPGKAAIARFLSNDAGSVRWLRGCIPKRQHLHVLSSMLFGIEGGLVDRRLRWETGDWLLLMARKGLYGLSPEEVSHGQELLRLDLPILNEERRHVAASNLR